MPSPSDGTHVWVASFEGNSVTELTARRARSSGDLGIELRVQQSRCHRRRTAPTSGWRTDARQLGHRAHRLDGRLVKVISGSSFKFDFPDAIAVGRHPRLGGERSGNSVTELTASTGALVKVISGSSYKFNDPRCHRRRTAPTSGWRTESATRSPSSTASTGALVKVISGSSFGVRRSRRHRLGRDPRLGGELR